MAARTGYLSSIRRDPYTHQAGNSIREHQIQVYTQSRVTNISDDSITFNRKGKDVTLDEIDTVVVAAGMLNDEF